VASNHPLWRYNPLGETQVRLLLLRPLHTCVLSLPEGENSLPELITSPVEIVFAVLAVCLSVWLCLDPVRCLKFLGLMPKDPSQAEVRLVRAAAALILIGFGSVVILFLFRAQPHP
jgi:hypothetical protein